MMTKVRLRDLVKVARIANPELFPLVSGSFQEVVNVKLTYRHLRLRGYEQTLCNGNFDTLTQGQLALRHHGAFSMQEFPLCASCGRSMARLLGQ